MSSNSPQNTTRRNRLNASNRASRVRALTLGQALSQQKAPIFQSGNSLENYTRKSRNYTKRALEKDTELNTNNNWVPQSIKNLRSGLPEHDIISRMQNRMAAEIAQAEATGRKEVVFRFPLTLGKKLLQALTFLLSILTLPAKFLAHLFGMVKAKVSPPPSGIAAENWGRTRSMIEEGRFGSRANQILNRV